MKARNTDFSKGNFINDAEKMRDFKVLSKEDFLRSYSYLTEEEYDNTLRIFKEKLSRGVGRCSSNAETSEQPLTFYQWLNEYELLSKEEFKKLPRYKKVNYRAEYELFKQGVSIYN